MIEQIKVRITELEAAIQNLVTNHTAWSAQLAEAKHLLEMAEKHCSESCESKDPEAVDNVVDETPAEVVQE
jgi:hypothetical protein